MKNDEQNPGSCARSLLLLCLAADAVVTPQQQAELDAHLPHCADCRRAAKADLAVRRRLLERAGAPAPAWLAGFASRTAELALAQLREARSQNRLLWMSAAAALLLAVGAQLALRGREPGGGAPPAAIASVREAATHAVFRPPHLIEGK